jgi:plasmid stability protein
VRTTLTLDDDVAAKIRAEARKSGRSFKQIVNEALRDGLLAKQSRKKLPPFKVKARPLGLRPGLNYDKISELIEEAEGPFHR